MNRSEAVEIIAEENLAKLSESELAEQLDVMLCEAWDNSDGWEDLPKSVKAEFESQEFLYSASEPRYIPALMIWQRFELSGLSNAYLLQRLRELKVSVHEIWGSPAEFFACPCCGYRTIDEPHAYCICRVCWWEDDGIDNADCGHYSGPNHIGLIQGRINYIKYGLFDPKRADLMKLKKPEHMYERGRKFTLKNGVLAEESVGWSCKIASGA